MEKYYKVGVEGAHLSIVQAIYENPTAGIILNGQKLKAFTLRSGFQYQEFGGCAI